MDVRANDIRDRRNTAVKDTVAAVRRIEREKGVNAAALDAVKAELLKLAARRELFPIKNFPVAPHEGNGVIYRLSEDEDHRFALYASTGVPGKGVHPHNHTTWAVIVGVHGDEHNVFYRRSDDGSRPGKGVTLMPDDIHSIFVTGTTNTVHLHLYGLALDQLHERVMYDTRAGTYKVFPATQNIKPI